MTATKNDQFCDPPPHFIPKNLQQMFYLKTKESADVTNFKTIRLPCGRMVPDVVTVIRVFFSVLEKIATLLFEGNKPIIKTLLKDISKP